MRLSYFTLLTYLCSITTTTASTSSITIITSRSSSSSNNTITPTFLPRTSTCNQSFFNDHVSSLRGGAVTECATLAEVDQIVTDAALQGKLVVIDFTATWCGPCKMVAPIYEQLSEQFGDRVIFLKVDVDDNSETAMKYSVSAMPTFLFIHKGEVVDRVVGANVAKLQELIQEFTL